jgi:hypothetical protein
VKLPGQDVSDVRGGCATWKASKDKTRSKVDSGQTGYDFCFTSRANILARSPPNLSLYEVGSFRLQDMSLFLFVAWLTNVMHRFGTLGLWLQSVGKRSRRQSLQFIALLLCLPCFKVSNFCFKVAYSLNQSRALLVRRKNALLGIENDALEFEDLALNDGSVVPVFHRLRDIHEATTRRRNDADRCHVNHKIRQSRAANLSQNGGGA